MPDYRVDTFAPQLWEGPCPGFVRQHITTQARPGTLNVQHTKLGTWGDEFTVRLTAYYSTFALAEKARREDVEPLTDLDDLATVWYAGVNYYTKFQHKYRITRCHVVDVKTIVAWQGTINGLQVSLASPTRLVAEVSMVPHEVP